MQSPCHHWCKEKLSRVTTRTGAPRASWRLWMTGGCGTIYAQITICREGYTHLGRGSPHSPQPLRNKRVRGASGSSCGARVGP